MALGKIGDRRAVKPLLEAGSGEEADPFLKHAIIYALFEIGDIKSLPEDDPIGDQVRLMTRVDRAGGPAHDMPEIQLADPVEPDPDTLARQQARLEELTALLPEGDPGRGEKLFHQQHRQIPLPHLSCHGRQGRREIRPGPDRHRLDPHGAGSAGGHPLLPVPSSPVTTSGSTSRKRTATQPPASSSGTASITSSSRRRRERIRPFPSRKSRRPVTRTSPSCPRSSTPS